VQVVKYIGGESKSHATKAEGTGSSGRRGTGFTWHASRSAGRHGEDNFERGFCARIDTFIRTTENDRVGRAG
jgi:hypothetical protein